MNMIGTSDIRWSVLYIDSIRAFHKVWGHKFFLHKKELCSMVVLI